MRCPKCGCQDDKVIDSRASREGATIRRRRQCIGCGFRFTTYEEVEHEGLVVLKRDGRREEFSKDKLMVGIRKACQKRPISPKVIEDLVEKIVNEVTDKYEREVPGAIIGKLVMDALRQIDEVAYASRRRPTSCRRSTSWQASHDRPGLGLSAVSDRLRREHTLLGGHDV
jgi:transcriptional repressor NrdR